MSKLVVFPAGKLASAVAYANAVNADYSARFEPGGSFTYPPRDDATGRKVVAYYGEIVNGLPFDEPQELVALRADGDIAVSVMWPSEDV